MSMIDTTTVRACPAGITRRATFLHLGERGVIFVSSVSGHKLAVHGMSSIYQDVRDFYCSNGLLCGRDPPLMSCIVANLGKVDPNVTG
jgi:hypothetical protein